MKQFGKILNFELKNYLKNKAFVGVTLLLVAIIAVVMFFPRITSLFESGDPGDSTADLPVLLVKAEDPAQAEMVHQTFAAAFVDYDVQVTDKDTSLNIFVQEYQCPRKSSSIGNICLGYINLIPSQ